MDTAHNLFIEYRTIDKCANLEKICKSDLGIRRLYDCVSHEKGSVRMQHVMVTGGAGFVGSHLVDSLMLDGFKVSVLDNLSTGRKSNIEHWIGHEDFKFIEQDVSSMAPPSEIYSQIYHLASPASPAHYMADPIKTINTIVLGSMNILGLAERSNKTRVVIASTSEIYGDPLVHPQAEDYWGNTNPNGPRSCYDEGKRLSESLAMAYVRQHNLSIAIARIFNTYGPRMQLNDGRVISNFVSQAIQNKSMTIYGNGTQTRSFQYVSDLVSGLRALMNTNLNGPFNLGNPEEITITTLASRVKQVIPESTSTIHFGQKLIDDPNRRRPDITKAINNLAWTPKIHLFEGLQRTVEYFRQELDEC